jgi:cysteine-rich repeat protein
MTPYRGVRAAALSLAVLALEGRAAAQLVINEVDYDQPGTDEAEFIEIRNGGPDPVDLDTWSLVLVDGDAAPAVYATIDLPAVQLAAGDYYVVCGDPARVPDCDLDASPDSDLIQDGAPDAIQLSDGGTTVDAVSYEGSLSGYGEGTGDSGDDGSEPSSAMARFPDGADSGDNQADFSVRCATPGAANASASTLCACGDGTVDAGEVCDDGEGNGTSECGCTTACDDAPVATPCGDPSATGCDLPDTCDGAGTCVANHLEDGTACANDAWCDGEEMCAGGVCTAGTAPCGGGACDEAADACEGPPPPPCGDGALAEGEACDDGNLDDGDGCTGCAVDIGWVCSDDPPADGTSDCYHSCGDGQLDLYESCDDDNVDPGDGCDPHCQIEPGWACGEDDDGRLVCQPMCGDGLVLAGEECDDGNLGREDGCSHCRVELGWQCDGGEPTGCTQLPDDGGCSGGAGGGGAGAPWLFLVLVALRRRARR